MHTVYIKLIFNLRCDFNISITGNDRWKFKKWTPHPSLKKPNLSSKVLIFTCDADCLNSVNFVTQSWRNLDLANLLLSVRQNFKLKVKCSSPQRMWKLCTCFSPYLMWTNLLSFSLLNQLPQYNVGAKSVLMTTTTTTKTHLNSVFMAWG